MTGSNFKYFTQWLRKNNHKLKNCSCGCYEGYHDPTCAQVQSEEVLYEKWQEEVEKQKEN